MSTTQMRAVLVSQPGDSSQLQLGEVPRPAPSPTEILVKIKAIGVNRMDIEQREGRYPVPAGVSSILGVEMAGVIEALGSKVTGFKISDRVFGLLYGGAYAEYCVIDQMATMLIPPAMSFETAAAIPENCYTAWQSIESVANLQRGHDILIHAGASGVSTVGIQIAKFIGAKRIFTTAGSDKKLEHCRKLGATHTINYRTEDFAEVNEIHRETEGRGVDVIIDYIGADYWNRNMASLTVDGHMVMLAFLSGAQVSEANIAPILFKRLNIHGSTLRSRTLAYQRQLKQATESNILPRVTNQQFVICIDRVFPWEEVAQAHEYMEANHNLGKIILKVED
ncbi:quinone oxidoreductase [Dimargaris cristalligena]|uniref:Quinone oxidoreductase n=1 Tax=Dimargaris cristalligena TaxID=215637 RepID=A0A4P9ZQT0_9FUNG|nr:quinone oxidoreductase [Dimargaris cristalligena]|eukprot:RKP35675.1 quinone oxidoreductase [Dimargaris cristalligena]